MLSVDPTSDGDIFGKFLRTAGGREMGAGRDAQNGRGFELNGFTLYWACDRHSWHAPKRPYILPCEEGWETKQP